MAGFLAATKTGNNAQVQSWLEPPPSPDRRSIAATLRLQHELGLGGDLFWKTDTLKIKTTKEKGDARAEVTLSGPIVWCLGLGPSDPKATCARPAGSRGKAPVYLALKVRGRWYVDLDINTGDNLPDRARAVGRSNSSRLKNQLGALGATFNAGNRRFIRQVTADAREENLAAIQADASQFRDVIFEFDDEFRKIHFPHGLDDEVNAVLNASGTTIAQLDAMIEADDADEMVRLLKRVQQGKRQLVAASNELARQL